MSAVGDLEYLTKQFGVFLGKLEDGGIVRNYRVEVWFNSPTEGSSVLGNADFVPKFQALVSAIEVITTTVSFLVSPQNPVTSTGGDSLNDGEVRGGPLRPASPRISSSEAPAGTTAVAAGQLLDVGREAAATPPKSNDEISAKPAARKILKKRLGSLASKGQDAGNKLSKLRSKLGKRPSRRQQQRKKSDAVRHRDDQPPPLPPPKSSTPTSGSAAFACSHCGLTFSLLVLYNAHLRKEHKNVTKLVPGAKCGDCGQKFLSVRALENHCEAVHGDARQTPTPTAAAVAAEVPTADAEDGVTDEPAAGRDGGGGFWLSIPKVDSFSVPDELGPSKDDGGHQVVQENDVGGQTGASGSYRLRDRTKIKPPRLSPLEDEPAAADKRRQDGNEPPSERTRGEIGRGSDAAVVAPADVPKFPCEFCGEAFATQRFLEEHEKKCVLPPTVDKKQPFFSCLSCNLAFRTILGFRSHECSSPNFAAGESLPAFIADRELFDELALSHLPRCIFGWNIGMMDGKRKFICSLCYEEVRSHSRMAYHMSRCKGGPFKCELCTVERKYRPELDAHKVKAHKKQQAFFCDECSASYERKSSLLKHKLSQHEHDPIVLFRCVDCSLSFEKQAALNKHRINVHKDTAKFKCDKCVAVFGSRTAWNLHTRTFHAAGGVEKRFACTECGRKFLRKEHLQGHQRIHNGGKALVCETCGKAFSTRWKLTEHRNRHNCGAQLLCSICGQQFLLKGDLVKHVKEAHPKKLVRPSNWKYAFAELTTGEVATNGDLLSAALALADIDDASSPSTQSGGAGAATGSDSGRAVGDERPADEGAKSPAVLIYRMEENGGLRLL